MNFFSHEQCLFCKIWGYHTSANEDLSLDITLYQFVVTDISGELAASHLQGQRSPRLKNRGSIVLKQEIWTFTSIHQPTVTLSTSSLLIKILVKWETGWSFTQSHSTGRTTTHSTLIYVKGTEWGTCTKCNTILTLLYEYHHLRAGWVVVEVATVC
jgi:hypothetical protein